MNNWTDGQTDDEKEGRKAGRPAKMLGEFSFLNGYIYNEQL